MLYFLSYQNLFWHALFKIFYETQHVTLNTSGQFKTYHQYRVMIIFCFLRERQTSLGPHNVIYDVASPCYIIYFVPFRDGAQWGRVRSRYLRNLPKMPGQDSIFTRFENSIKTVRLIRRYTLRRSEKSKISFWILLRVKSMDLYVE